MPVMWMVWPDAPTVPQSDVVKPAAEPVVDGADQPAGARTSTWPPVSPPVPAVNVNVRVLPAEAALAVVGDTERVPLPSVPTVTWGEAPSVVSVPLAVDLSCTVKAATPVAPGAVTVPKPLIP